MYRRRHSPYSGIEEIQRSRQELTVLVLVSVIIGILLNILASGLYDWLTNRFPTLFGQYLLFILGVVMTVGLVALVAFRLYGRQRSQTVQIDVAVPYHLENNQYLTIARQHKFRPPYQVAWLARTIFTRRFPLNRDDARRLAAEWQQAKENGQTIQDYLAHMHGDLVDALLIYALHRYGENALGPEAQFTWWYVPLAAESHALDDLPDALKNNPFVHSALHNQSGWKLLLPQRIRWDIAQVDGGRGRIMRLLKPGWGKVVITRLPQIWVSPKSGQPGKVLSEGLQVNDESDFYVLGSRIEVRADFKWTFLTSRDLFHRWAEGLLAQLEEALDWSFFNLSRADRIVWDIPWKLGDLPGPQTSFWRKLDQLEKKLTSLIAVNKATRSGKGTEEL